MNLHSIIHGAARAPSRAAPSTPSAATRAAVVLATCAALAGCGSLLEIDNPNNVTDDALNNPAAAASIVAGAENSAVRAMQSIFTPYAAITDETVFRGSRDDYQQLDKGNASNPANEYTNAAALNVNEARWLADNAVTRLEGFLADGTLNDETLLHRAYLNKAVMYAMIGDMYDDFTISDRTVAGDAVGEENMAVMYDSALSALDKGVAAASGELQTIMYAMRARVKHAKGVWALLNPVPASPANPLVGDNGYVADAQAALGDAGWVAYDVTVESTNQGNPPFGFELNNRVEITTGPFFVSYLPDNTAAAVILTDPIDAGRIEPFATENIELVNRREADASGALTDVGLDPNLPPLRVVSRYEMLLLVAEAELAAGDDAGFDAAINQLRALKGLSPYTGAGLSRVDLLAFERRVALLFMGRRLNDMYRFGVVDANWNPNSVAVTKRGCLFPIGIGEREANDFLNGGKYQAVCQ